MVDDTHIHMHDVWGCGQLNYPCYKMHVLHLFYQQEKLFLHLEQLINLTSTGFVCS